VPQTRDKFLFKIAMGVRKEDAALKDAIDTIISEAEASGRLEKILSVYGVIQLIPESGSVREPVPAPEKKAEAPVDRLLILARSDEAGVQIAAADSAAADPKEIDAGRKLYKQACYKCHGEAGISGGTVPDVRKFKDKGNDEVFLNLVRDGRAGTAMPPWKEILNDDEIKKIIAYVRSLPVN
jgi:mono/diheme cytochrome c family protein